MDSMYIAGSFTNTSTGKIIGDSLTNASTLINNGYINAGGMTNNGTFKNYNYQGGYAYTNASVYENYDSLILSGSVWNNSKFNNMTGARVNLTKNFHNYHSSGTAVFDNDGIVRAFDSWYNTDTVKGSGQFIVSDTSANSGFMKENFSFCDLTPASSAPFVDLNSGSISANITWCTTGIKEEARVSSLTIFPNPNNGTFFISGKQEEFMIITNQLGQEIKKLHLTAENNFSAQIDGLDSGVYFISGKNYKGKVIVTR
jgi:hypothetical protein